MSCKSSKTSHSPQKLRQGDQLSTGSIPIQVHWAKRLVSFQGQVKIREGQAEETAMVSIGDDGGCMAKKE